jgi:6,7-dimethyl-8-ribityllumazine synthase
MAARAPSILIVEARYYEGISDALLDGAMAALRAAGARAARVGVPGALEIPAAIRLAMALPAKRRHDGFVALGCVIRGETTHYETVAEQSAAGLQTLALQHGLAIGNGILTVENEEQAWERARAGQRDCGGHAARAALALVALRRQFASRSP